MVGCAVGIVEEGESTLQRTAAKPSVLQNSQKNVEDTARGGARGTFVDIGHSTGGIVKDAGAFQVHLFIPGTRRVSRATV